MIFRIVLFSLSVTIATNIQAQESNPLQSFEFLIGGTWVTQTTHQTFEWGFNNQSVQSKLYFLEADEKKLVGEITWFWHPGEQKIKGYGHSTDMEMNFFDYTTSFETPSLMSNEFYGYGGSADEILQYEKLEFVGDNEYIWTYYTKVLDELKPSYSITFQRVND